jgi:hypothetical protein
VYIQWRGVDALVKINMRVLADKIQKKYAGTVCMIGDTLYMYVKVTNICGY